MTEYLIRLDWPTPALWQNRRAHWSQRSREVAAARKAAWSLANQQRVTRMPNAVLEFTFHPPPKSRPDLQNMPATQKAAIDGIADAMGCDDRGFRCVWPMGFGERVKGGSVLVHVKPGDSWQSIGDLARKAVGDADG